MKRRNGKPLNGKQNDTTTTAPAAAGSAGAPGAAGRNKGAMTAVARTKPRNGPIGALDVGTDKVCCLIGRMLDDGALRITGFGHQNSEGLRNGAVVDMDAAEAAIRAAVDSAEHMAGERLQKVLVNISGGQLQSAKVPVAVSIAGHTVGDEDLRRIHAHARSRHTASDRTLLHTLPEGYTIDGNQGIRDPRGMVGDHLGVTMHLISAASGVTRNLSTVIDRCHLDIEGLVASPYASGLACLDQDEMDLGVMVVDMGCGTTTLAVFLEGSLVHVDGLPVGGGHVTKDIARGLTTPIAHAERMKTLYGNCLASVSDEREMLKVPMVGEEDDAQASTVPRSMLTSIIQPRVEETFELVRSRLEENGLERAVGRQVVLTGGASQLAGVREMAATLLNKQVRVGRPAGFAGLPEAMDGPGFTACAGLLRHAVRAGPDRTAEEAPRQPSGAGGPLSRLGLWLKENF